MEKFTISTLFAAAIWRRYFAWEGPHGSGTVVSHSYAILLKKHDLLKILLKSHLKDSSYNNKMPRPTITAPTNCLRKFLQKKFLRLSLNSQNLTTWKFPSVWYTQSGSCNESKHVHKNDIMQYLCNNGYSKWWGMRLDTHWLGWHND